MKRIHTTALLRRPAIALLGVMIMLPLVAGGCARRASSDWAQTSPVLEPERTSRGGVSLGAWTDPMEIISLGTIPGPGVTTRP